MKIVIAPDSFKGSLSASGVAEAIAAGIRGVSGEVEIEQIPMADGGEGTVEALVDATEGEIREAEVTDPLGDTITAEYGILGDEVTAVIEMAAASGLPLVPEDQKNPMVTTTYGTGELIREALDEGCRKFIIGIGGSATTDGGVGMAQALGLSFRDEDGKEVGFGGGELEKIAKIDIKGRDPRIDNVEIRVACDVDNPLCGPRGAAHVYGPQKGATPEMVERLDAGLDHLAGIVERDLDLQIRELPGSGAAGGLGGGLVAFLGAELDPGVEIVVEVLNLTERLTGAELVITGEGQLDEQTAYGKVPVGVARAAAKHSIPVIALAGSLGEGAEVVHEYGIDAIFSIQDRPQSLEEAIGDAERLLKRVSSQVMRLFILR